MTFLQALYGSQYKEIAERGKDGAKGRLNGNLFLSAFIIVILLVIFLLVLKFVPGVNQSLSNRIGRVFGYNSGKTIGKLLAIPLLALIYLAVSRTVGSENNFNRSVKEFYALPEDEQHKANQKLLIPFFAVLGLMLVLALSSL